MDSDTSAAYQLAPVQFSRLTRRGILLGLSLPQLVALSIAVLTVVLTARAAAARTAAETAEQPVPVSGWRDRARGMRNRPPTRPGPGAWRSSTR